MTRKIIIEIDDDITDSRALQVVNRVILQGLISRAPGKEGHMQYCYHTTVMSTESDAIGVSATRRKSGTHKFYVRKETK